MLYKDVNGKLSCILTGDINIQNRISPELVFSKVEHILSNSDILYGNLEGCLFYPTKNDLPSKTRWRHSDEAMVRALTSVGFSAVGCANNVFFGAEAISHTLKVLDRSKILHCGAGNNFQEATSPAIVNKNGISVCFLQYTARLHSEEQAATDSRQGVAAFNPDSVDNIKAICEQIETLRKSVDVVVFSHHLRKSCVSEIEPYQSILARRVIDSGADIVYGHGAHLIQSIEIWKDKPIFHCIGELVFDYPMTHGLREGLVIKLDIGHKSQLSISFMMCCRGLVDSVELVPFNTDQGKNMIHRIQELSPTISIEIVNGMAIIEKVVK